jgi:hypothetical protein
MSLWIAAETGVLVTATTDVTNVRMRYISPGWLKEVEGT